jgi:FdhD protein
VKIVQARKATTATKVTVMTGGGVASVRPDKLATEEPLSIRAGGPGQDNVDVTVTMRTPGHDFELAVGFLWSEGVITDPLQVREVKFCDVPDGEEQLYNIVTVRISHQLDIRPRAFTTTSSCGVCGTQTLDDLASCTVPVLFDNSIRMRADDLLKVPVSLRENQKVFAATGGIHAAAIIDATGKVLLSREDVGRHNAVDKVVGRLVLDKQLPAPGRALFVSGRTSYEIVQKAAVAGLGMVAGVSAPSSLAVETADRMGITLVGFVRGESMNVYTHPERLLP